MTVRKKWTEAEKALLRQLYPDTPTRELARQFSATEKKIYHQAHEMGIKKSDAYMASVAAGRLRRGAQISRKTQFKPGHKPWNSGMKFDAGGRSAETRFKPGNRPHTWVPVGSERITKDGYLQRKISDTGYVPRDWKGVQILTWEAHHGPVPKGHMVVFRDGDMRTGAREGSGFIHDGERPKLPHLQPKTQ